MNKPPQYSDEAKRLSDKYNTHRLAMGIACVGQWFVVRMTDAMSPDADTLYGSKAAAVHAMGGRSYDMIYVCIKPSTMSYKEAEAYISYNRKLHKNDWRMPDPDSRSGGMDLIPRLMREDARAQFRALFQGR